MSFLMRRGVISSSVSGAVTFDANTSLLNGTDQYYISDIDAALNSNEMTICGWMRRTSSGSFDNIVTKNAVSDFGFILQADNLGNLVFFVSNNGSSFQTISFLSGMSVDTWYFAVGRVTSTNITVRLSSAVTLTESHTGGIHPSNAGVSIGQNAVPSNNRFEGSIAFVKMYNRALSDAELDELEATNVCVEDLPANLQNGLVYAPRLANWGTNAGEELDDQSPSGIVTTAFGSPTYTDQGLIVECS